MPRIARDSLARMESATKQVERRKRWLAAEPAGPRRWAGGQWFYTTASGGTASRTGTTKANSVLALGTVTAVPCLVNSSGNPYPDNAAANVTLTCGVIPGTSPTIASDRFVFAVPYNGRMLVIHVASCS